MRPYFKKGNVMSDLLVGRLFNDFVDVFQLITKTPNRKRAVNRINSGLCGMAAMAVGNVLIHGYGYDPKRVEWRSHCLHMWLRVDGVDYDSLFPQGYSRPVNEEWLLSEVSYNSSEMGDAITDKEDNSGYQQPHLWYCQLINEIFYERYGVEPPEYVLKNRKKWLKKADTEDWRGVRKYERRAAKARLLPLKALVEPVVPSGVWPMTHYHFGEFEESTTRVLRDYDFPTRGVSKAKAVRFGKRIQKESRINKIHVRRM